MATLDDELVDPIVAESLIDRRRILAGGLLGAVPFGAASAEVLHARGVPWQANAAASPDIPNRSGPYLFFTAPEAAFVEAAAARIIPRDEAGPGAIEAGVPWFLDRQLAGEFGQASRWYMQGPWAKGEPTQGYQSRLTPAQMYRAAVQAVDAEVGRTAGKTFAALPAPDQDALLKRMEAGEVELAGVDAKAFFALLLQNVIEGFFCDPIYGGNRDMIGWKLIGFSGARYDQRPYVLRYGEPYPLPPVGIAGRPGWSAKS
jgi:gluconate 2-dehydrogenase gamma chain